MYNNLLTVVSEGILTITINREAKLNALTIETIREIYDAIKSAESNDEVAGIIITGAGPKAFVAGADISEFANFTVEQGTKMAQNGHKVFNAIENSSKPIVAAVSFCMDGNAKQAFGSIGKRYRSGTGYCKSG